MGGPWKYISMITWGGQGQNWANLGSEFCIFALYISLVQVWYFFISRGGGKKNISHILQGVGGSQKVKIWYRYMCTAPKRKINQNPNYNLVVFFWGFWHVFFHQSFWDIENFRYSIGKLKDSTQNFCVSVPHGFNLLGGGGDGGGRGWGGEIGKWGEESD